MACGTPKGELAESARQILLTIETEARTEQEIERETKLPIFKVRSTLRDLLEKDAIVQTDETYKMQPHMKEFL